MKRKQVFCTFVENNFMTHNIALLKIFTQGVFFLRQNREYLSIKHLIGSRNLSICLCVYNYQTFDLMLASKLY